MRVAIVEDEAESVDVMKNHFETYGKTHGCTFGINTFRNVDDFIKNFRADYDLILLDIKMPGIDGMSGARIIRKSDPYVPIVFVTSMSHYAVKGYAVGALDFIIKHVGAFNFNTMLDKVIRYRATSQEEKSISVTSAGAIRRIFISHIFYIEVYRHKLTFYTSEGETEAWGSLTDIEAQLPSDSFVRCNNSYLINLKYVDGIEKEEVIIGSKRLPISHLKRKDFIGALAGYLGSRR